MPLEVEAAVAAISRLYRSVGIQVHDIHEAGYYRLSPVMSDRLKRLAYRAHRRGFKEADIIFTRFAEAHLAGFTPAEADEFEQILELQDHDIFNWVMGRSEPPAVLHGPVFAKFLAFARGGFSHIGL